MDSDEKKELLKKLANLSNRLDELETEVSNLTAEVLEQQLSEDKQVVSHNLPKTPIPSVPKNKETESLKPPPYKDVIYNQKASAVTHAKNADEDNWIEFEETTKKSIWSDDLAHIVRRVCKKISVGFTLGCVAVLCFIFASSLLIKMAIENGWLTPMR